MAGGQGRSSPSSDATSGRATRELRQHIGMRVGILGLGLMGSSFALALRRAMPGVALVGRDSDAGTQTRALERGVVQAGDPTQSDVLVLATPISALPTILAGLAGHGGAVTDMASTKAHVMR